MEERFIEGELSEGQRRRAVVLESDGGAAAGGGVVMWGIPAGSVLIVGSDSSGAPVWFEVAEPEPTYRLVWDVPLMQAAELRRRLVEMGREEVGDLLERMREELFAARAMTESLTRALEEVGRAEGG